MENINNKDKENNNTLIDDLNKLADYMNNQNNDSPLTESQSRLIGENAIASLINILTKFKGNPEIEKEITQEIRDTLLEAKVAAPTI